MQQVRTLKAVKRDASGTLDRVPHNPAPRRKMRRLPPWLSTLGAIDDHSGPSEKLANLAASPSRIAAIAPRLYESRTTTTTTPTISVSPITHAAGSPFTPSGSQKDHADLEDQEDRQTRIPDPFLPSTKRGSPIASDVRATVVAPSQNAHHGPSFPHPLEDLWNQPERMVGLLVVTAVLSLGKRDLRALQLLVGNLAQDG